MESKVLIFYHYGPGINGGGPMGFVNQNIEGVNSDFFIYPNKIDHHEKYSYAKIFVNYFKSKKNPYWDVANDLLSCGISNDSYWFSLVCSTIRKFKEIKAWNYRYIYFHDMYTLKACLHLLNKEQTVIFQPHSPEQMSLETIYFTSNEKDVSWALLAEKDVFNRANIIVLPNKDTIEIYKNNINKKSTIHFIISGCAKPINLRSYPLDSEKINLLYIGRRTNIKGFDILLETFEKIRKKRSDINLLLLGGGEKIENDGVFDIGFSNTPHNWINSVDYVISTNRQSYFDLAVMETIAVGTPIMMTSSQGHKMFIQDGSEGIIDLGEAKVENISEYILSTALLKKKNNSLAVEANKKLFEEKYSKEKYLERLNDFCKALLND